MCEKWQKVAKSWKNGLKSDPKLGPKIAKNSKIRGPTYLGFFESIREKSVKKLIGENKPYFA